MEQTAAISKICCYFEITTLIESFFLTLDKAFHFTKKALGADILCSTILQSTKNVMQSLIPEKMCIICSRNLLHLEVWSGKFVHKKNKIESADLHVFLLVFFFLYIYMYVKSYISSLGAEVHLTK